MAQERCKLILDFPSETKISETLLLKIRFLLESAATTIALSTQILVDLELESGKTMLIENDPAESLYLEKAGLRANFRNFRLLIVYRDHRTGLHRQAIIKAEAAKTEIHRNGFVRLIFSNGEALTKPLPEGFGGSGKDHGWTLERENTRFEVIEELDYLPPRD